MDNIITVIVLAALGAGLFTFIAGDHDSIKSAGSNIIQTSVQRQIEINENEN